MRQVQFFMITAHWTSLLFVERCGFPLWPAPIMISQNFLMLALFGDFYRKSYLKKSTAPTGKVTTAAGKKQLNDSNNNVNTSVDHAAKVPGVNGVKKLR